MAVVQQNPLVRVGGHLGPSRFTSENVPTGYEAMRCHELRKECIKFGYPEAWVEGGTQPAGIEPHPDNPNGPWTKDDCLKALKARAFMPAMQTLRKAGSAEVTLDDMGRVQLVRLGFDEGVINNLKTTLPDNELRERIRKARADRWERLKNANDRVAGDEQGAQAGADHHQ